MSPSIWRRIAELEAQFSEKRKTLENLTALISRHGEQTHLPNGNWGILPQLRRLRQLAGIEEDGQND